MLHEREPTLEDLLNDPVVRQVMNADGVTVTDICELFQKSFSRTRRTPTARWMPAICGRAMDECRPQA